MRINDTFEIVRTEDPFTRINNRIFQDKRLNLKTLGLLCLCLSLPEDWNFSIRGLAAICKDKQTAIMTALDALEELGYLRRDRNQNHQENGKFGGIRYVFFDAPAQPCIDFPNTVLPNTDEPYTENQSQEIIKQETKKQEKPPVSPKKEKSTKGPMPAELMARVEQYAGEDLELRDALLDFAEKRKARKKPINTQRTLTLLLSRLNELSRGSRKTKLALINEAIMNDWLSFYSHEGARRSPSPPAQKSDRFEPEVSAWP